MPEAEVSELVDRLHRFMDWLHNTLQANLGGIFAEDDWTIVVKLHAMIETGLNTAIVLRLQAPELDRIIARLDTSNPKTGKSAFAKALDILPNTACVFIQQLSELRNHCVHDIRNFGFNLEKYLVEFPDKKNGLLNAIKNQLDLVSVSDPSVRAELIGATIMVLMQLHAKIALYEQSQPAPNQSSPNPE